MAASRLETVRRVAVLRTTAARAAVGAAGARQQTAQAHHEARVAGLAGTRLVAGTAAEVQAGLQSLARLADDVNEAGREVRLREDERRTAVLGWTDAARRARLLDDVCARHRAERDAAAEKRTQHVLDDLAARRTGAPA